MAARQPSSTAATADDPMLVQPFTVRRRVRETADTFSVELVPESGATALSFQPGQFNMLYVFGVGDVPISVSGDPADQGKLVHTVRAVGRVTNAMSRLKAGDPLGVRGPFGVGWPMQDTIGHDVLIIAGGIGLAPLRPVIHHLLHQRADYGRIVLLYGARTPQDLLYTKDLERWRSRLDFDALVTVDHATGEWHGNVGVVTGLIQRTHLDPLDALAMICGPEIMMRFCIPPLIRRGLDEQKIFLSLERNMKCGCGLCGHCQLGPTFVCKDGPVYRFDTIKSLFTKREL